MGTLVSRIVKSMTDEAFAFGPKTAVWAGFCLVIFIKAAMKSRIYKLKPGEIPPLNNARFATRADAAFGVQTRERAILSRVK